MGTGAAHRRGGGERTPARPAVQQQGDFGCGHSEIPKGQFLPQQLWLLTLAYAGGKSVNWFFSLNLNMMCVKHMRKKSHRLSEASCGKAFLIPFVAVD